MLAPAPLRCVGEGLKINERRDDKLMTRPRKVVCGLTIAVFAIFYIVAATQKAQGYPPFVNYAQRLGYPAKDCTYCHIGLQGGGDKLGPRGKWLVAEKVRRGEGQVDIKWLKDYKQSKSAKARPKKKRG